MFYDSSKYLPNDLKKKKPLKFHGSLLFTFTFKRVRWLWPCLDCNDLPGVFAVKQVFPVLYLFIRSSVGVEES